MKNPDGSSGDNDKYKEVKKPSAEASIHVSSVDNLDLSLPILSKDLTPALHSTYYNENDVGRFIGRTSTLSIEKKKDLTKNCWTPPKT